MSKIALVSPASGTATFSITTPSGTSTDRTLTLPDSTGTIITTGSTAGVSQAMLAAGVAGNGPAFSAGQNLAQSINSGTWTKLTVNSEDFDTANCYDNTTNYRFTPNVAGYYQVSGAVTFNASSATANSNYSAIYKNGLQNKVGSAGPLSSTDYTTTVVTCLVYLNGSTDYVELFGFQNRGTSLSIINVVAFTHFEASMVRAA